MSRAASRMSRGVQNGRQGRDRHQRDGIDLGRVPIARARRSVLLRKLVNAPAGQRDAIRASLRRDGSERAKGLLAELERRWAAA